METKHTAVPFNDCKKLTRLNELLAVDPRITTKVYHLGPNGFMEGWGPIGAQVFYVIQCNSMSQDEFNKIRKQMEF